MNPSNPSQAAPPTARPPSKTQRLVGELRHTHPEAAAHIMQLRGQANDLRKHLGGTRRSLQRLINAVTQMMLETNPDTISSVVNTIAEIQTPGYHKENP